MCGDGIKTRMLDCVRSDGKSVDLNFCQKVRHDKKSLQVHLLINYLSFDKLITVCGISQLCGDSLFSALCVFYVHDVPGLPVIRTSRLWQRPNHDLVWVSNTGRTKASGNYDSSLQPVSWTECRVAVKRGGDLADERLLRGWVSSQLSAVRVVRLVNMLTDLWTKR